MVKGGNGNSFKHTVFDPIISVFLLSWKFFYLLSSNFWSLQKIHFFKTQKILLKNSLSLVDETLANYWIIPAVGALLYFVAL